MIANCTVMATESQVEMFASQMSSQLLLLLCVCCSMHKQLLVIQTCQASTTRDCYLKHKMYTVMDETAGEQARIVLVGTVLKACAQPRI